MAINKNHEFEELDGIKCAIVERNITHDRAIFLKDLLVFNGYTVVIAAPPPPKAAKAQPPAPEGEADAAPELFVLGVTDVSFNPVNAIFGRQLKTQNGCVVTQAVWNQTTHLCDEEVPYYTHTKMAP